MATQTKYCTYQYYRIPNYPPTLQPSVTALVTISDDYWRGTATDLLKELETIWYRQGGNYVKKEYFPKDVTRLSIALNKIVPQLLDADIFVEHVRSAKKREIVIRRQRRAKGFFATYIW